MVFVVLHKEVDFCGMISPVFTRKRRSSDGMQLNIHKHSTNNSFDWTASRLFSYQYLMFNVVNGFRVQERSSMINIAKPSHISIHK